MLDVDSTEQLIEKLGGNFKLTTLIQKRLIELRRGARPLVEVGVKNPNASGPPSRQELMKIVVKEILEDKIRLAPKTEIEAGIQEETAKLKKGEGAETDQFQEELKKIKEQRRKEMATMLNPKE